MRGREGELVGVLQVEVVDAEHKCWQKLALLERLCQGADEGCFADSLDAVQADDEGSGGLIAVRDAADVGLVCSEALEDWWWLSEKAYFQEEEAERGRGWERLLKGMHLGDLSSMIRD